MVGRHPERDPRGLDLALRAHQSLRHCCRRNQERSGNLFGVETSKCAEGQCNLSFWRQRRVAAGEDQAQAIVFEIAGVFEIPAGVGGHGGHRSNDACGKRRARPIEARSSPQHVNRLEASGRNKPGSRIVGHAIGRPAFQGGRERVVHGLLGEIEIAEEAYEGGQDTPRLGAIDRVNDLPGASVHDVGRQ